MRTFGVGGGGVGGTVVYISVNFSPPPLLPPSPLSLVVTDLAEYDSMGCHGNN